MVGLGVGVHCQVIVPESCGISGFNTLRGGILVWGLDTKVLVLGVLTLDTPQGMGTQR